jgi:hypothetical protein
VVVEASLFGRQLRCERTYTLTLGKPGFQLADKVTNLADLPAPLMMLYHVNVGFPLVAEGAELFTPYEGVYPRDAAARPGLHRWSKYDAATPGYAEQVFFHHLKYGVDNSTRTMAALAHPEFGFLLEWDCQELPYLTQWKNTREGIYVCGVEPGNCIPEGQNAARRTGRLQILEPGQSQSFGCDISVLPDAESVQAAQDCISELRMTGTPAENCKLDDYAQ